MTFAAKLRETGWQVGVLIRAGLLPAMYPPKYVRAIKSARHYGMSPATTFALAALRSPNHTAILDESSSATWADLDRRTDMLAAELAALLAGKVAPTVALMARNSLPFAEVMIATGKLGGRLLLLNTGFSGPQLAEVIQREGADIVACDGEFSSVVSQINSDLPNLVVWTDKSVPGRSVTSLIDASVARPPPPPRRPGTIVALTSGTTGSPRGAERSGGSGGIGAISGFFGRIPLRRHETIVVGAPMFHAWGFAGLAIGSSLACTLVTRRRFDPEQTLALAQQHRASVLWLVPVMLERIMALPNEVRARYDLSTLRIVALSGSALRASAVQRFMDEYGDVVYNNYSSTEVGWVAIATPADLREAPDTAGLPLRGTEVRILDQKNSEQPPNTPGRIFVRNDMLLVQGYTAGGGKSVVDGFMETGDVGHLDTEGRLFIDGRSDDMIVSGGENVYPAEVERLLATHPAVLEVAVVGVPDDEFGQRLAAFVVPSDCADPSTMADQLRDMVRDNLARYKVPKRIEVIDKLPRNAAGKLVKRELIAPPAE
jgi:acyl-CoA synthetase (AMP-forming)/AMP-acid ligase II